jgi:fatty acid desaturase
MTGNLSFQIEHHLFPDLPSNRYQEIAPKVRDLFERYGLTYTTGSLPRQVGSAWKKVFRLSLPNDFVANATAQVLSKATPRPIARLVRGADAETDTADTADTADTTAA